MAATPERTIAVPAAAEVLSPDNSAFGGLSGLEVAGPDSLVAISDRGWVMRIGKAEPHAIAAFDVLGGLPAAYQYRDVESIRRAPDGGWWLAFEGVSRVAWYGPGWDGLTAAPRQVLLQHELRGLTGNRSLEAVAILPDGRGLALAEQTGSALALLFDAQGRTLRRLAYETDMPPVDALALPDGGLLILTRSLVWPLPPTFATRLEYAAPGWDRGGRFRSRTLFALDSALPAENYEGMAAEPLAGGALRVWLVSDDNYLGLQSTVLARLDLPAACLQPAADCQLARGATALQPRAPTPRSRPSPPTQ